MKEKGPTLPRTLLGYLLFCLFLVGFRIQEKVIGIICCDKRDRIYVIGGDFLIETFANIRIKSVEAVSYQMRIVT